MRQRKDTAATFIASDRNTVPRVDLQARLAERDARLAADTRTEAERWLGDPPPGRSALGVDRHRDSPEKLRSQLNDRRCWLATDQLLDVVAPPLQRRALLRLVVSAIVNAGYSTLVPADVIKTASITCGWVPSSAIPVATERRKS